MPLKDKLSSSLKIAEYGILMNIAIGVQVYDSFVPRNRLHDAYSSKSLCCT